MGEYRFSVYFNWQLGLSISYEYTQIVLRAPFLDIHIATSKYAYGFRIFKWKSSE